MTPLFHECTLITSTVLLIFNWVLFQIFLRPHVPTISAKLLVELPAHLQLKKCYVITTHFSGDSLPRNDGISTESIQRVLLISQHTLPLQLIVFKFKNEPILKDSTCWDLVINNYAD